MTPKFQLHFLRIILLLSIFFGITLTAAAYQFEVDGIYYYINDTGVTVTYGSDDECSYSGDVVIPPTVTFLGFTYLVTAIGHGTFEDCTDLTSVSIPNTITTIDHGAFSGCTGLTNIEIPNSVSTIGDWVFQDCTGLTSIAIPNSVNDIGFETFLGCIGLTSVTIPNSVNSIDIGAFRDCTGLTGVNIPNSVTSISYEAFRGCNGLTCVTIGNSVSSIDGCAFNGCDQLSEVYCYIADPSIVSIGNNVFSDYDGTRTLYVPVGTLAAYRESKLGQYFDKIVEM